jgi:aminoglycoside phosphotransferase (APT) family kinase protein
MATVMEGDEQGNHAAVPGIDVGRLAHYLPTVLEDYDPAGDLSVRLLAGGRSNLTCLVTQRHGQQWVLRRPPLGHVMPTAHDMAREFRTLAVMADHDFPAPRPRALCDDPSVLGATFLIYEYVPGLTILDTGTAHSLAAPEASEISGELIRVLTRLHAIPPPALGLGRSSSSISYLKRQVIRWMDQWRRNQTRELSAFDQLSHWLQEEVNNLPADYPVTFVHGDFRLDNVVLDPLSYKVRAVLDWEMSTLGDPLMDVALLLAYWEQPDDNLRRRINVARGLTTSAGFWPRDRLLSEYVRIAGLRTDHLEACLGLACLKLAAIMEGIHYRHLSGKALGNLSAGLADAAPAFLEMGLMIVAGRGLAGLAG